MIFDHPEQRFLYDTAKRYLEAHPGGHIMEIGSFTGGSAKCFAAAIQEVSPTFSKLICIDPFFGHYDSGLLEVLSRTNEGASSFPAFCRNLGDLLKFVVPVAQTRANIENFGSSYFPRVGLVLVDGAHEADNVFGDLQFSADILESDGTILCHDADWIDVKQGCERFCEKNITFGYQLAPCDSFFKVYQF